MAKYKKWLSNEGLSMIEEWAKDGLTDAEIAHNMQISLSTFYEWQREYSEFSDTLKKAKDVADAKVEDALFKRAVGYETSETKEIIEKGKVVSKTVVTKQVLPSVTAQIFWLKNRRPDKWRDGQFCEIDMEDSDAYFASAELSDKEKGGE